MLLYVNNTKTRLIGSVALIISVILILYVGNGIQSSYGQQPVKTLNVKVQLDKSVVKRGDTQTIQYRVFDAMTGQPVSGAIVRATVGYADAVTVRQFTAVTDATGQASISWQIESNATPGSFSATFGVSPAAYIAESFDKTFAVVSHSVDDHHHHHHDD
jgi:uncharacterized protein YfaS (alpha-2-macroglobulin family)